MATPLNIFLQRNLVLFIATIMENVLTLTLKKKYNGNVTCDEIGLMMQEKGMVLPCGMSSRWSMK